MKRHLRKTALFSLPGALLGAWIYALGGCAGKQLTPAPPPPAAPDYVAVPHPLGQTIGDLRSLFLIPQSPKLDSLQGCDADFRKLNSASTSKDEISEGVRELVRHDPVAYHWCFYGALLSLEDKLKDSTYIDEKQKATLEAYSFLVPVARAFMTEFHDSRYLRWAVRQYRQTSEWVFYRKVDLTPTETSELVDSTSPFGLERAPASEGNTDVIAKYGLAHDKTPAPQAVPAPPPPPAPADAPSVGP